MLLKRQVMIVLFVLLRTVNSGQTCDLWLKGTVRDEDNSENLGFAIVKIMSLSKTIQTDEKGEFELTGLCPGDYQVLVLHVGCSDTVFNIRLSKSRKIVFRLPHHLNALSDIEIVGKHEDTRPTQTSGVLEGKSLDKLRGLNLADQLKELGGVTTFNTGPTVSKPMINGMQGYRILVLNNGVRQEGQQWGTEHAPEIDPFIARKLTVLRGASAVRYGSDAIGGVILVEPEDLPDTAGVTGELNLIGHTNGRAGASSLRVQGYFDRLRYFSWRIQGTLRRSGDIKTPGYYLKNTSFEERNFSYALSYHRQKFGLSLYYSQFNSTVGIFTGAHVGNLGDLYAAFNSRKPQDSLAEFSYKISRPYQNIEHELIRLSGDLHTGPRSRVHLNYALQTNIRQEFDSHTRAGDDPGSPESDYRLSSHTAEVYWEHDYIRSFRGKFGLQGIYQQNEYRELFFIPNYVARSAGAFAIERFVRPVYELEAGLRYDVKDLVSYYYSGGQLRAPSRQFANTTFHLGAIVKFYRSFRLNMHLASGWRAPAVNELYSNGLHHGAGAIERGDPGLDTEYSTNAGGTLVYSGRKFSAEAGAYTYAFDNYIYYAPAESPELTLRGAFPVFYHTQNKAGISGGDLLLSLALNRYLKLKAKGMWVRGINRDTGEPLVYMPADRYELGVLISLNDAGVFRDNYIEPVAQHVAKQWRVPRNIDYMPAPEAYQLFGITVGTTILVRHRPLMLGFSVTNAANTAYRDYLDRFRYFSDAAGRNFTLRLRMPFTIYQKRKQI